jgi:hypothetical protein
MPERGQPVPVHGQLSLFVSRPRMLHRLARMFVPREIFLFAVLLGSPVGVGRQVVEFCGALMILIM